MSRQAALDDSDAIKVLILGRTGRRSRGGIGRSCQMIAKALLEAGDVCRIRDVNQILTDIPSDTDLVWHYGDLTHIDQQIQAAREAGVPILINSTYDGQSDRRRHMISQIEEWCGFETGHYGECKYNDVFFAVFSHEAENDPRLERIKDRLLAVPKTIREYPFVRQSGVKSSPTYSQRSGICIGEIEKLFRPRLVSRMDVPAAIRRLRESIPGAEIVAYDQYSTDDTPTLDGVKVVKLTGKDEAAFPWFLSQFRLFVSLVKYETFAMVPAESQAAGTPVLYRHMSQSLSSHLGFTGVIYEGFDELAGLSRDLYGNEARWSGMSRAGLCSAMSRSEINVGVPLSMALRRLLIRWRAGMK